MAQVPVDDSEAVAICGDDSDTIATGTAFLRNAGTDDVWLGDADVDDTTGYLLAASTELGPIPLSIGSTVYGICAAGESATVQVLALGN